jgi:hypothetical protein
MRTGELAEAEYKLLCMTVRDACSLAGVGDESAGRRCLSLNLEHARELAGGGEAWAADLVDAYLSALEEYAEICARYHSQIRRRGISTD